jgi:hypothetical protein
MTVLLIPVTLLAGMGGVMAEMTCSQSGGWTDCMDGTREYRLHTTTIIQPIQPTERKTGARPEQEPATEPSHSPTSQTGGE